MANEKRLIDPSRLIRSLKAMANEYDAVALHAIINALKEEPAVDAMEVVYGRWIERPAVKGWVYCSECATIEKYTDSNYRSKHCPNCGAKMMPQPPKGE